MHLKDHFMNEILVQNTRMAKYECLCQSLLEWYRQAHKGVEDVPVSGHFQIHWVLFIDSLKSKKIYIYIYMGTLCSLCSFFP